MDTGTATLPQDLLIGGVWHAAEGGGRIEVLNPSTGQVLGRVPDASVADAAAAVDAADAAAAGWAATPPRTRAEILRRAWELMTAEAEALALLIARENGKALADARGEVVYAAEFFRWYAEEAVRIPGEMKLSPSGANRVLVDHRPVGISLLITPWNFPAAMATRKIGPALAAGCTCILKPATETPLTALAIGAILARAGVPPGVVNILTTRSAGAISAAILRDSRVRKLSFTGSTEVGRVLLREAAGRVVNCSMELGGNAPFIVFDDADLEAALDGAMIAKMRNGGEACTAANRFYVQRGIHDAFVAGLRARMQALTVGAGENPTTQCGAMVNSAALEKMHALVEDAVAKGARVELGGRVLDRPGCFYAPTVLTGVSPDAALLSEEIFGPIAPVVAFDTEDQAVAMANDTEYGLVAYLYCADLSRGLRVSRRLEAGMIGLNRGLVSDPAAPFGGMKQSGIGREGGQHGLLEFLEPQYIAVTW